MCRISLCMHFSLSLSLHRHLQESSSVCFVYRNLMGFYTIIRLFQIIYIYRMYMYTYIYIYSYICVYIYIHRCVMCGKCASCISCKLPRWSVTSRASVLAPCLDKPFLGQGSLATGRDRMGST